MKAFKLDSKGDLVIENGDFVMVEGNEELTQSLDRILTTNIEEWFLDPVFGLDYKAIQGKGRDVESIKLAIKEAIYQEERIKSAEITNLYLNEDRHLIINGTATDVDDNIFPLQEVIDID